MILIMGGTTEGREVAELLAEHCPVTVSVTTAYGASLIRERENLTVHQGTLDDGGLMAFIATGGIKAVVDATHPYADKASKTAIAVTKVLGIPYLRLERPMAEVPNMESIRVADYATAAEYLCGKEGNIMLTIGSYRLEPFLPMISENRVWVRMLPDAKQVMRTQVLGVPVDKIIGMQGPFSVELNAAMLREYGIAYLVTKETSGTGGYPEKLEACKSCGVVPIIIEKPHVDYPWMCNTNEEVLNHLKEIDMI